MCKALCSWVNDGSHSVFDEDFYTPLDEEMVEKYSLVQQMNRAAVSVPSNIAEGVSRNSSKEKIYFINIAYGSLMELICQMEISLEIGYIEQQEYDEFLKRAKNLAVKLSNFVKAIT